MKINDPALISVVWQFPNKSRFENNWSDHFFSLYYHNYLPVCLPFDTKLLESLYFFSNVLSQTLESSICLRCLFVYLLFFKRKTLSKGKKKKRISFFFIFIRKIYFLYRITRSTYTFAICPFYFVWQIFSASFVYRPIQIKGSTKKCWRHERKWNEFLIVSKHLKPFARWNETQPHQNK